MNEAGTQASTTAAGIVPRDATQRRLDRRGAPAAKFRASSAFTLGDLLESKVREGGARALLHYGARTWSYAEANAEVNRCAHALHALGVRRGDVIALAMENRPEFVFAWFALAKTGAVAAFLNTQIGGRALAHALEVTGAKRAIVGEECLAAFDTPELAGTQTALWLVRDAEKPATLALRGLTTLDLGERAAGAPATDPDAAWRAGLTAGDAALYIFTSGTTGLPKAAVISHARWLLTGEVMAVTMEVGRDDCFYTFLPLYHAAASMSSSATAICSGAGIALRRKFSRREFWPDIRRYRATVCQYVGEICRYLLAEPPGPDDRDHTLRKMLGAGLGAESWARWIERFGPMDIYEGWGATEANANTINIDNRAGSCGRVPYWEKTNLRIVRYDVESDSHPRDAQGHLIPCRPGEVGEAIGMIHDYPDIVAGRFEGYTSREATERKILRSAFVDGDAWWSSGDLLRYDEDGYCWFVDRIGDTFRWKSENVSTMEVAEVFADMRGVESVTVYGVQVPGAEGRAGMAAVVMQAGHTFDPTAFYERAATSLPRYAAPLFVRVAPVADMTSTFKLRKVDLQRQGIDPALCPDPLHVRDDAAGTYVPLTEESVARALAS
ncbi:MAG: Crotonobetaine/carnitine--CoA ligase [Steroidobacteraceae bacterium]|nr:Crotonobetaine/carnitine--CoA ligase [Steroidobacteraceae bacterium]